MRLNEVIKQVDLSKRAIKFYEEKGLLKTKRDSNGYRNYTDKDISLLKEISSYRKMGIGLSDIKEILNHKSVLKQILIEKKKEITISQNELEALEKFIENNSDRCYHCKKEVFKVVKEIAAKHNIKYVLDGTNLDDLSDFRPGLKALEELNIISPLKECGLTKDDIRQLSKDMELNTHNKPAFACLATRIPYGTKITKELLKKIEKSEEYLISVRFKQFRVRAHNDIARIEVGKDEIHKFFNEDLLNKTNKKLKEIGFKYVTLDMAGYEMGSMNK